MSFKLEKILAGYSLKEIGKNIEKARIKKGYTAAYLADKIGVSHVTIGNVEDGEKFSLQTLVALTKELDDTFGVIGLQKYRVDSSLQSLGFNDIFIQKIREIVREEVLENSEIHEKIQGIVLATQKTLKESELSEISQKEKKAG